MVQLKTGVRFGQLVTTCTDGRHTDVVLVVVHLVRVFAGAYKRHDSSTGCSVALLLITLRFSFTGYLRGTSSATGRYRRNEHDEHVPLVGRTSVTSSSRYRSAAPHTALLALHVAILPLSLTLILPVHIWRVRKDGFAVGRGSTGGLESKACPGRKASTAALATAPHSDNGDGRRVRLLGVVDRESVTQEEQVTDDTVFAWPHLMVRHVVATLGVCATVLALGVWFQAPLKDTRTNLASGQGAVVLRRVAGLLSRFQSLVAGIPPVRR